MTLDNEFIDEIFDEVQDQPPIPEAPPDWELLEPPETSSARPKIAQNIPGDWIDPWGNPFRMIDAYSPRPPVEFLVNGLYRVPSLDMIFGSEGDLKTMLMVQLCLCVASGHDFLPQAPWQPGGKAFKVNQAPVMFIDFDNGPEELHERFEAIGRALNVPNDIPLYYHSFPDGGLDAGNPKHIGHLSWRMARLGIKFLTIDNLGIVKGRADENTDDMIPVMNHLRWLAEENQCVVNLIHHQRKETGFKSRTGDRIRGHSSFAASLNMALSVTREEYSDRITLKQAKQRGFKIMPFGAAFTFTHKPGTEELATAAFFSLPTPDMVSDQAIENAILDVLDNGDTTQTKLISQAKEQLPEIGINRIRDYLSSMVATKKINMRTEKGHKYVYWKL
jgi:hypothetical protein